MITGEHTRECDNCKKMLPYIDFDYFYDTDDIWEQDFSHAESNCYECYKVIRGEKRQVVSKGVSLTKELSVVHARMCPKCTSKRDCGCYDVDKDGYR